MAGMFGNRKARRLRIPVSKDDIKKAIAQANDRLKSENDKIKDSISKAKTNLKSVQSEIKQAKRDLKNITSTIDSRISECTAIESQLLSLQSDLFSLTDKFKKELDIKESLRSSVDDLMKKEKSLIKSVALLDQKKDDTKSINANLKSINTDLKLAKNSYDEIKQDLTRIISDKKSALNATKEANITRNIAKESCAKVVNELAEAKLNINRQIQDMDSALKEKSDNFNVETSRLDSILAERLEEIETNTSLAIMKAKEYEAILTKVIVAENKIKHADQKIADILKHQEESIANIKKRFETWKLTQLDYVAKLKLKGKIENIDKAGLSEILGG